MRDDMKTITWYELKSFLERNDYMNFSMKKFMDWMRMTETVVKFRMQLDLIEEEE